MIKTKKLKLVFFLCLITITNLFSQNTIELQSVDKFLNNGNELFDLEKYQTNKQSYKLYQEKSKNSLYKLESEFYQYLSDLISGSGGELNLLNFIETHPEFTLNNLGYYELGTYFFDNKNYTRSSEFLNLTNPALLTADQSIETKFKLGYSYLSQKEFDKAGTQFDLIKVNQNKYTYAASYYSGYINYRNQNYDQSLIDLEKASENESYTSLSTTLIANIYYKKKDYEKLLSFSNEAIKNKGSKITNIEELYLLCSDASYQQSDYKNTIYYSDLYSKTGSKPKTDLTYKTGFSYYVLKDYNKCIEKLKSIADRNDTIGQFSAYYLGLSWLKINNKQFAFNAFNQAKNMNFNSEIRNQSHVEYIKTAFELGNFNESINSAKIFEKNYPSDPNLPEISGILSEAYLNTNNYDEAIKYIDKLKNKNARVNKSYQYITFYRACELYKEENLVDANLLFDKSLSMIFDKEIAAKCYYYQGEIASLENNYAESLKKYKEADKLAIRKSQLDHQLDYSVGYSLFNTKQYSPAADRFKKFLIESEKLKEKKYYNDALLRLGDCYYAQKKYIEAAKIYQESIDENVADIEHAYFHKGIVTGIVGQIEQAKEAFKLLINQYPTSRYIDDARYNLALLEFERGNYEQAVLLFTDLLNKNQFSNYRPLSLQKRAIANSNLKRYEESISDYRTILKDYPNYKSTEGCILGLQEAMQNAGKGSEFEADLQQYKSKNPNDKNIENLEFENAKTLYLDQKYLDAGKKLELFISQYPQSEKINDAKYYLGDCFYRSNYIEKAIEYLTYVSEQNSTFTIRSFQKLGDIYLENKNYSQSKLFYQKLFSAANTKKDLINSWIGLSFSMYGLQELDSASHYAEQILIQGGASPNTSNKALLMVGKVSYEQGKYVKAEDELIKCVNAAKDANAAEAQYLLCSILYKQKKYKSSLEMLFQLTETFSNYSVWYNKAYLLIAENYFGMNEIYQTKATLTSIIEKSDDLEVKKLAKDRLVELENTK